MLLLRKITTRQSKILSLRNTLLVLFKFCSLFQLSQNNSCFKYNQGAIVPRVCTLGSAKLFRDTKSQGPKLSSQIEINKQSSKQPPKLKLFREVSCHSQQQIALTLPKGTEQPARASGHQIARKGLREWRFLVQIPVSEGLSRFDEFICGRSTLLGETRLSDSDLWTSVSIAAILCPRVVVNSLDPARPMHQESCGERGATADKGPTRFADSVRRVRQRVQEAK